MKTTQVNLKTISSKKCPNRHNACLNARCWVKEKELGKQELKQAGDKLVNAIVAGKLNRFLG